MDNSKKLAPTFRNYMTKGQRMSATSELRTAFYQQVVDAATKDVRFFDIYRQDTYSKVHLDLHFRW